MSNKMERLNCVTQDRAFVIFRAPASTSASPTLTYNTRTRLALPHERLPQPQQQTAITRTAFSRRSFLTTERMPFAPSRKGQLLNTQINQPLTGRVIGSEYLITSGKTELPRGSFIRVLTGVPVEAGDLVLFQVGRYESAGRWSPNVGGINWIQQPGRLIACMGNTPVRIVGQAIPCPFLEVCESGRIKASPGSCN